MEEGNIFSLSVHISTGVGVYPVLLMGVGGGYPIPGQNRRTDGYPHLRSKTGGYPHLRSRMGWGGYHHLRLRMGAPPKGLVL